ncbi:MAG TPA: aromatic amino acid ammonia-lyase [Candidatus Acidoferrales bacterium]|nr:aromatic amino acid ammonia-lyase [Candidatus Acidoferrales bacterium]
MAKKFREENLIAIDAYLSEKQKDVRVEDGNLTIPQILSVARHSANVEITSDTEILHRIQACYDKMMQDIKNGVPIYGGNTGYGARASNVLTEGVEGERIAVGKKISESITHVDVSVGPLFEKEVTRAAMLIRVNMLMRGVSAVKIDDLNIYCQMLNKNVTPLVNQYGGVGASGDLAHNSRVLSAARQLPGVRVWDKDGNVRNAKDVLMENDIPALQLDPKAGLGLVNGDNFSTALASLLAKDTLDVLLISFVHSAMVIEVLRGTNRSFHPLLAAVRPHAGQKEAADIFRYLLNDSKLAYQEMKGHERRPKGIKVQDAYSLRCLSQYQAVNIEKIKAALETITINANSVSDNPLWVSPEYVTEGEEPWNWVSGGNFIAMHMVEVMDGLRKTLTQITKISDRHLARIINVNENNGLPPNLSDPRALSQCAFKGVQIQSGMFDVYSSLLSMPVSTFFGVHEENNQDITSHALTSGILGLENLRITRYALAQNLMAVTQAVDLRGGLELLAPQTKPVYEFIRNKIKYVEEERPLNNEIETIYDTLKNGELMNVIREQVFHNFQNEK